MAQARFSIREAVAEGFAFWRAHWRKAVGPLAVAALASSFAATGQPNLVMMGAAGEFLALIMAHAVYYRIALADMGAESASVNRPLGFQLGALEGRLFLVNLLIGVVFLVMMIVAMFLLLVLILAVSDGAPPPAVQTVPELYAVLGSQGRIVLTVGLVVMLASMLLIWARFSMAAPMTAARGAVNVFSSLPLTRGSALRLAGVWLVVRAPVFLLLVLAQQFGALVGDPATGVLATLAVGVIGVFFIQPILVGATAHIYRRLSAAGAA
ncbi:MAG: hypothetical protein Q8J89_16700 [Caulobacter sp.]|nr:hypothetical protein [Caulobacter sp.]